MKFSRFIFSYSQVIQFSRCLNANKPISSTSFRKFEFFTALEMDFLKKNLNLKTEKINQLIGIQMHVKTRK